MGKKSKGAREDVVVRISKENHRRLKALNSPAKDKTKESLNECVARLLDASETLLEGQMIYLVGTDVFESADTARGEAIMNAARFREPVQWPKVAVIIGEDVV